MLNLDSGNEETSTSKGGSKKERYFWQYNVQAKGPKGQRLVIKTHAEDPHNLNEVTDPVFSPSCSVRGIKVRLRPTRSNDNCSEWCFSVPNVFIAMMEDIDGVIC